MTTTLSNLYVEKASSEHPLALWMLNEKVDFVSQITENQRTPFRNADWSWTFCEVFEETSTSFNVPFPESSTSRVSGFQPPEEPVPPPTNPGKDIILTSKYDITDNLVSNLTNFSFGFHIYIDTTFAKSISYGYTYYDVENETDMTVLTTSALGKSFSEKWAFFSETFPIPDPAIATNLRLTIKIRVLAGGLTGDYDFLINGLSLGQRSEEFNKISYGVTPETMPSNINLPTFKALVAYPYGGSGSNGYYLSQGYELSAKNFGIPLVFGSSNVTKLYPNVLGGVNYPSLIFPGSGFLNKRGQSNDYTVEMWLRIDAKTSQVRRIFGPISSDDGLYVDGQFLTFKLGSNYGSHYVGEWFRPMLVHIRLTKDTVVILLNGEEVISFRIDEEELNFPSEISSSNGKSQDWLGFYAYEDVTPIDVDSFSIYSYTMPTTVAKRHWVWGQAVTAPEQTNSSINSVTAYNDYSFANYASNYNYPDFANFKQAFFSNVSAGSKTLALPDYRLPDFSIGSRTTKKWFKDIQAIPANPADSDDVAGLKYLTLKPNDAWNLDSDFIYFENLGVLNEPVESLYGIFKSDGLATKEILIKLSNKITNDFLVVYIEGTKITYELNISGTSTILTTKTIIANKRFTVGLNLKNISLRQVNEINKFFTNQSALSVSVGGDGSLKFSGKIYKVGFDANYNNRKHANVYDSSGIFTFDYAEISNAVPAATTISSTGTVGTIVGPTIGPWTGKVSNLSSLSGLAVGDVITATSGTGSLGSDGKYVVTELGSTSFNFSATGGTIPTVGTITNIKKNTVTYTVNNNFIPSDTVIISGITPSGYNNSGSEVKVISYTNNSITINSAVTGTYVSGGMVVRNKELINHTANYTLTAIEKYGTFFADIAVSGYWEDYMPLSYFAKAITDFDGNTNYELDSIQFNQDFPEPPESTTSQSISNWTYEDLRLRFSNPKILLYSDLDNAFYTKWNSYADMANNTVKTSFYETEDSILRTYVSFQRLQNGSPKNLIEFSSFGKPLTSGILDPESQTLDWETSAYELTTGTVIYPPTNTYNNASVDFNDLAIVYHLDFKSEGILHQPIKFKELQLASHVLERTDFTPVGSRFGIPVYYYSKSGIYYDLKAKNPISTYKRSTPHLYLNRQSGWKLKGEFDSLTDRGLAMPVNLAAAPKIEVSSAQMWLRYSENEFPDDPIMVFSIEYNEGTYVFYIQGDSSLQRAKIFGVDLETQQPVTGIKYYLNGQPVATPYLSNHEWVVLGLEFPDLLDFSSNPGKFNLNGPLTYNNVSYNIATNIEKSEVLVTRSWSDVKTSNTWENLQTTLDTVNDEPTPYTWNTVKIISQSREFSINPTLIYQKYTGSNRIVVDDESNGILVKPEKASVYNEVSWSDTVKIAV